MATEQSLPPGYRFVPTDEEVVELCLLPRIQDQPLLPNDIIEDDPLSAPPWALLEKHGRKHQAFFFAACQAMNAKGNRQKRTCAGHGTWQGQGKRKRQQEEGQEVKKKLRVRVHGSAEKMKIEWDKYGLNFQEHGVKGSTGWVMHEYSITAPPEFARSPVRVYCIRFSDHGRNAKKNSRDAQHRGDDDEFENEEEVDDEAGAIATATCSATAAAEEDPAALFINEYPPAPQLEYDTCFPVMVADVVNPNPADGAGAGAGYHQDLDSPALVDDDSFIFMNSLPDLLPSIDFSQ
ncbi:NAC domain-containing protein 83-like [Miscanthus floridulus]|uniref:NAC domain-containing protein 83-like n=1 Tax=Miscanthus floridulus TaxID=154761 RepID=UPI003457F9D3